MLSSIAVVPSAPVMVPELASGAAPELADLRAAVFAAAATLPSRWVAVGVGATDEVVSPGAAGTFGGYGVDLAVSLAPDPVAAPTRIPLCALIAGWIRGRVAADAHAEVRAYSADRAPDDAVALGRALRAEVDAASDPIGVLVVADGANTLTPPAPGGYDPDSVPVQEALNSALASGDSSALARLDDRIGGRVAYQVLAGLAPAPVSARELWRGAPYGVGYFVGAWSP